MEAFGLFGTFTAIVALAAPIATARLEFALPIAERQYRPVLKGLIRRLSLGTSVAAGIVAAIASQPLEYAGSLVAALPVGIALALGIHSVAVYNLRVYDGLAHNQISKIAVGNAINGAGTSVAKVIAYFAVSAGPGGLIGGTVVGQYLAAASIRVPKDVPNEHPPARWATMKRFSDFFVWNLPEALVTLVGTQAPLLIIGYLFGPAAAGLYFMANRILQLPMALLGQGITKVFLAGHQRIDPTSDAIVASKALLALGSVVSAIAFVAAPTMFDWALGAEWRPAGEMARWLAMWSVTSLALTPVHGRAIAARRQRLLFILAVTRTIFRTALLVAVALQGAIMPAVITLAISGALLNLGTHALLINRLRSRAAVEVRPGNDYPTN